MWDFKNPEKKMEIYIQKYKRIVKGRRSKKHKSYNIL